MDDTYFSASKPGKPGRGKAGKTKVVVAVETPGDKPRFAAMRLVPRVSSKEILTLVRECLAAEAVVKTDGWQGYSFLGTSPNLQMSGWCPVRGRKRRRSCPGSTP